MDESSWLAAENPAPGNAFLDWGWPAYEFDIPVDWSSAVYVAYLQKSDAAPRLALPSIAPRRYSLFAEKGKAVSSISSHSRPIMPTTGRGAAASTTDSPNGKTRREHVSHCDAPEGGSAELRSARSIITT